MLEDIRTRLPVHPAGNRPWSGLIVDGLVARPLRLTLDDLAALPQRDLSDDFSCVEGWTVPAVPWRGVPLAALLDLVGADPEACWIQASAADFSVPLPLHIAGAGILALELEGAPLPREHGGPIRLVAPGSECYASIKWIERIELRREPAPNTARDRALARLG